MEHNYRLGSATSSDISVVQTKLAFILCLNNLLYFYIYLRKLLPSSNLIIKSDIVFIIQLANQLCIHIHEISSGNSIRLYNVHEIKKEQ